MQGAHSWLVLAAVAWVARAGPGPPIAPPIAPPTLRFAHATYNVSIPENSPPRTYAEQPPGEDPLGVPLPAPDARVRFRIRHGDKDKFFKAEERTVGDFCFLSLRTRAGHADVLNRERRDLYRLELRATALLPDGAQLEADVTVLLAVLDENDLGPLFYPTEYEVTVPEDAPLHSSVARVTAEDADLGLNGEIYYSLEKADGRFAVHPTTGEVILTRPLAAAEAARHELVVLARDRASLLGPAPAAPAPARAALTVHVAPVNLHAPELRVRRLPELPENSSATVYAIVTASDADAGDNGRVASLDIVDGDPDGHFRLRAAPTAQTAQAAEWELVAHALLDRELAPSGYNLTLRATDAGRPPRAAYLTLPVTLADRNDNAPVFSRELYEASVPETAPPNTPVIRLKVTDRDEGLNGRVYIEIVGGNEGGEFAVNPDTGVLYTALALDAELKALHALTVAAVDRGVAGTRKQSSAKVLVAVLDANDNDPRFERDEMRVLVPENGPSGAVVARVTARDADSGENAYVSYSIANLQPVPFEVDHFSGAVRTTRLLDYESMRREYSLRLRAGDWGLPYRRQAELRLLVRLQDVNDNRPQFERVDCVGYLPRRLPVGADVVTLSAIDFDAGDVVAYRIVGGNEDSCFALDATTGVVSLACDLSDVRADTRVLNVTATDGTHFADATSLALHLVRGEGGRAAEGGALECRDTGVARRLTDLLAAAERSNAPADLAEDFPPAPSRYGENLHAPEFTDFPVEVKVNESVALGTALVRLRARDRDLGYNGLLAYGISGGDPDSAFRIDPDTGELQVIGYLDRERESEYYLNVTVYDLGRPQRSASRLLPVTVLDVNDNAPRFEKSLASFRVTENALNGTAIFRANATDRDAGAFGRVTYGLAEAGPFCVGAASGELSVCAPLDREARALYELTLRATDGGGRHADARVRVQLDDVNDNAPRFAQAAYSVRAREDLPAGTLLAVLDAFDPDLGAAGAVTYALADADADAEGGPAFSVDAASGTLRTARALDYEQRQVYGVTVVATDGGQPALSAEVAVIVEVEDVDENRHAPAFAAHGVLAGRVREDAAPGARVLAAAARDLDAPGRDSRLAYYIVAGSGMAHFSIDDAGVIRTLTPLDRETVPHYWLTVCAQDHGLVPRHACIQVFVEVEDVNDMAPWPERAWYAAAVAEGSAGGARVAGVRAHDADAAPQPRNISYAIVAGNPDGLFSIDPATGDIVTTGRALDREASAAHALEVQCSDGELASTARVLVTVLDVNDHAPAFLDRFIDLPVPAEGAPRGAGADEPSAEAEAEAEADDEDEARGAWEQLDAPAAGWACVGALLALDADAGANGSLRYWARAQGAARAGLRVHAASARLYRAPHLPLAVGDTYHLTVRACDGGARCGSARVRVRGVRPGGGAPPALAAPPPLQVAELDAPGFLLAVLQATDPDGDALYYDIVGGDPRHEFYVGRGDGSLLLARRLLWERQARYLLNVSVTDGRHVAYATVNITVINDANEGGLAFTQDHYAVDVAEDARVGEPLATLLARAGADGLDGLDGADGAPREAPRVLYGLHAARAPASARLFRVHELTGVLELAAPLDRESAARHELTVWARDQAPRAARAYARVLVTVHGAGAHAPTWGRRLATARVPRGAAPGSLVAALRAADRDAGEAARIVYSLAGGDAAGAFSVDAALGDVRLARALPARGPREYALSVRAANPAPGARAATLPLHVTVVEPDDAPPRFDAEEVELEVLENEPAGTLVGGVAARGPSVAWYWLQGGRGRFTLNPASGALATAAPLDWEDTPRYDLTVRAVNMGGGSASVRVVVHVLDRNEHAPSLRRAAYRGRVSEAAAAGALVADELGAPLVLEADDADSPAHRQRAYEVLEPAAAALFRLDPTTGALRLAARLDYEAAASHVFTVRVIDAGTPRLPSDSVATVTVDVIDVNDCPPAFERSTYEAEVLLPSAQGVLVALVRALDPDPPADGPLKYDIIEGDPEGAFSLGPAGALSVARPLALAAAYELRVRASDGLYSSTARVRVAVRELDNSGLAFQQTDYYGSVVENTTKPATVAVLDVLGAALDEHVEFRILNPTEGFEVGATSGAVRSTGLALDREAREQYVLLLEARSGPRRARARLTVAVTDVNDNCPEFVERPYAAAVLAGAEPGAPVLRVRAVDRDADDNGEVRYEMKRGHGELFRVDRRTGQVTLKQTVDAHDQVYALVIAAFDGGVPACGAEARATVRVWAGGAAPRWARAQYELEAREDAAPGSPLGAPLQASSPLGRQLIYSLVEDAGLFEVQWDTGAVSARAALDHEARREYPLLLRATDAVSGAHADAELLLRVLDVNDCAPAFPRGVQRAVVREDAARGHLVLALHATDNDTGINGEISYSLSPAAADDTEVAFTVDGAGAVRVAAPLDRERRASYHLLATAADAGRPPLLTTAHVLIDVEDVNDNAPRMERGVVPCVVSAEAARGVAVARVAAWDPDERDGARLQYALVGAAAASRAVSVHPRTGVVSLGAAGALPAPRSLNVSVSDGAHASFARVKLSLAGANRAPPHFPHLIHEARARENQPPPLLLTTVKAYDEDAGEYGVVTYSIPSARLRETFAVDARSGALTARVALDREARAEWEVPVTAADGGGLLRHTTVRVRVLDLNDHAPEFPLREYYAAVAAERAPLAPFLTLTARDADAGEHARLRYSLRDAEGEPGLFAVDPHSGALSFARNASAYAGRSAQVWVVARDGGGLAGEAGVRVRVLAPGERAPRLEAPGALALAEDAAPGALLAQLVAQPPAARLRLAPAAHAPDLFALDGAGRLVLAGRLDREQAAEHVIGIVAEGAGSPAPATLQTARLLVQDVNEHAPSFHSQPYVVHLAENAPPHTSIVQLMADDPDAGANGEVRYSLADEAEAEARALFAVDAGSGWVTLRGELDREARAEWRLPLRAVDGGTPPRAARGTLVLRLVDYNDCPPRFAAGPLRAVVAEDAPAGTVVARLEVHDADLAGAPLAFFVAEGDPRARFQLRASGELLVARALDREAAREHRLRVAATDGRFTAYTSVEVTVLDVNDNPPYCLQHRYFARLPEDAANGTLVMTLETEDADEPENARLRYFLSGEHAHLFSVDKEDGAVRVAAALDREAGGALQLRAHAQDRARAAWGCSAELRVQLDDVNDNAPQFTAPLYSVTLPEDAELGTVVAKVHATDADIGDNRVVRYSLASAADGRFELGADSGLVWLRAPLDREAQAEHRLLVLARDLGAPALSATATVRLTVADVNDNPPEFTLRQYSVSVPELDAPGAQLLRVHATSRDTGVNADVYYSIVGGDGREDFALDRDSGALSVARPLDYERRRRYLLTVQAVDGGSPPLSDLATVNVTVLDANDNAPVFARAAYHARVREDAAVGARVLQVLADDADDGANGRVAYGLAGGDPTGRFAVDELTGYVSLAAPLDREAAPAYALTVRARDRGVPALEGSALLTVEVLDANDNAPAFERTNYSAVVREDRPLGHAVLQLRVRDADAPPNGAPFTFDFQSGNEMGAFRLEQDGFLRTATRFNHRLREHYALQVRVFDNGTPPLYSDAWVYVRVIEESQYPPVVTPLEVVVNSYLDEFPGGAIGRVFASDRDAYDTLVYALAPADGAPYAPSDLFEISAADGALRAAPRLDVGEYRLNVTVDDGKFVGFAVVRVHVVLVSDELLSQAIVVRFRAVSAHDFVLSHRKGFLRAVAEATDCEPADVIVVSVQSSGEGEGEDDDDDDDESEDRQEAAKGAARRRRQVARDLDVAFAVRAAAGFLPAEALRRRLHAHLERLEERARLVVEELPRVTCGGCVHGACAERVRLRGAARVVATDVFALAAPAHALRGACACAPGYGGARCDRALAACAACRAPRVLRLQGDGYLLYRVERGVVQGARPLEDELALTLRFRTRRERGTLAAAAGRVDYAALELAEGHLQFRMELGAGPVTLRAGGPVADGEWHEARLERRGASVRLSVDRRSAQAQAPPPAAVLDAGERLLLGAELRRHEHAFAPEQVTYGFDGCISDVKLNGVSLPLEEGGTSADGRVQLVRRERVQLASACPALAPPSACAAYPCLHGGSCLPAPASPAAPAAPAGYACACHARFGGARCELDSAPCASQPCLHGGACSPLPGGGYRCACARGLAGERCQRGRWCAPGVCAHGGACEEGEGGPSCRCRGYYGARCQYDVDDCAGEPCLNGATCLNEPGSFRCLCPPDRTGMNCGNPLYSDAVVAGGAAAGGARLWAEAWRWALDARWPLLAAAALLLLLLLLALLPALLLRRRRSARPGPAAEPLNGRAPEKLPPRATKLSNLEAVRRERPTSCAEPPPLNNVDTLRSYGSAGDELEGIPPDYRRNLNIEPGDRKPWSEQMHLHTFVDNKIYNDLKGAKGRRPAAAAGELVGGYHWDCSDWCGGGALPGISEVAGSERPDSSDPASPPSPPSPPSPADTDAAQYLVHPDLYLPRDDTLSLRARSLRDPDAASLITMLEERHSLLGDSEARSCSSLSARLCEIEDSDADSECGPPPPARHTDV